MTDPAALCQKLQSVWDADFPMVSAMGVRAAHFENHTLTTHTPLSGNTNIHGTAFAVWRDHCDVFVLGLSEPRADANHVRRGLGRLLLLRCKSEVQGELPVSAVVAEHLLNVIGNSAHGI